MDLPRSCYKILISGFSYANFQDTRTSVFSFRVTTYVLKTKIFYCIVRDYAARSFQCANQPVVGWLKGLWSPQPTRVQILVLAFISGFISGFRRFISGFPAMCIQWRRRFRQRRGVFGDFVNIKMICQLSLSEVLIGIGCACVCS